MEYKINNVVDFQIFLQKVRTPEDIKSTFKKEFDCPDTFRWAMINQPVETIIELDILSKNKNYIASIHVAINNNNYKVIEYLFKNKQMYLDNHPDDNMLLLKKIINKRKTMDDVKVLFNILNEPQLYDRLPFYYLNNLITSNPKDFAIDYKTLDIVEDLYKNFILNYNSNKEKKDIIKTLKVDNINEHIDNTKKEKFKI